VSALERIRISHGECEHSRVETAARYVCLSCGRDRTEHAAAAPCDCGSRSRIRIDAVPEAFALPGQSNLRYDSSKDWTVKYLQLAWNVRQMRSQYSEQHIDPERLQHAVDLTLTTCWDLADWLTSGPEPASVTPSDINRLAYEDPLRVCRAYVTRGGSARLVPIDIGGSGRAWIEYEPIPGKPTRYDALDLAERCLAAWTYFLTSRGVPLPSWDATPLV
jgi:hypothetical protein